MELLLPLGDEPVPGDLTARRWQHLMTVAGIDARSAQRLARTFPSLAAVYGAREAELAGVVGPVVASRIRWFLDAPLDSGVAVHNRAAARAA
jgi:ERCC4-type nuclease